MGPPGSRPAWRLALLPGAQLRHTLVSHPLTLPDRFLPGGSLEEGCVQGAQEAGVLPSNLNPVGSPSPGSLVPAVSWDVWTLGCRCL